jgi:hypothetical protein
VTLTTDETTCEFAFTPTGPVFGPVADTRVTVTESPASGLAGDWLSVKTAVYVLFVVAVVPLAVFPKNNEPARVVDVGP